jgi:DNA processing protein
VSEFPPGIDPRPLHFPRRNRILAALASVVVIVEGRARSGARSTVDHALAMGREVVAVPRDPNHEGSILPNGLLLSGAPVVTGAADLLPFLRLQGGCGSAFAGRYFAFLLGGIRKGY